MLVRTVLASFQLLVVTWRPSSQSLFCIFCHHSVIEFTLSGLNTRLGRVAPAEENTGSQKKGKVDKRKDPVSLGTDLKIKMNSS